MEIRLCGRLTVEHQGRALHDALPGRQGRLVLAYLALVGDRRASRDELIDAVWRERAPADPDAALRTVISRLRAALPEGAIEGRHDLSLVIGPEDRLDVQEAEAALESARSLAGRGEWQAAEESAREALEIARAPLLPGHDAVWLEDWRRRLEGVAAEALELCIAAALRHEGGDLAAAERAARELVEREPYRESGYLRLMEVQAARGNVAEALRVFDRLRRLLMEELGTSPGANAKAFHERLLRGEPSTLGQGGDAGRETNGRRSSTERMPLPGLIARSGDQRLVGRDDEYERLERSWREVVELGELRIVFLAGEAGIGKTSLAARFARNVHADGATVLYGRADPEALVPYQAFTEALRHLVLNAPLDTLREAPDLAELGRLVPELGRRLPELAQPLERAAGDDRYRLFSATASLLAEAARQGPVLLVLDDLHWADRSSLRLLQHVARYSERAPLLILGTYRDTGARSTELAATLTDLHHERLDERIPLPGLDEQAVGKLIADAAEAIPEGLHEVLHQETGGNPFFVVEMLRHLADGMSDEPGKVPDAEELLARAGVPEGVREVIERRLAGFSEPAKEVLTLAAILGPEFDLEALAAVAERDIGELAEPLEEALDAGLLAEVEGAPGRFSFAHAIVRETLCRRPSSMRRILLHRRAGQALERLYARNLEENAAELARHFIAAGEGASEKATRYSVIAAEHATTRLAHEEAAGHYARVVERTEPGVRHCELLLELGKARFRSGDATEARAAFREAAAEARALGSSELFARAALGFAGDRLAPVAIGQVHDEAVALLSDALNRLAPEDARLRAAVLGQLAVESYWSGDERRRDSLSREAIEIARQAADPSVLARALLARRFAVWAPDTLQERLQIGEEILRLAGESDDSRLARRCHGWRVADLLEAGEPSAAREEIESETLLAETLRQPLHLWHARVMQALLALLEGRFEPAERLASDAYVLGHRASQADAPHALAVQQSFIRRDQGRMEEVLDKAKSYTERDATAPAWCCFHALLHAELGHHGEAGDELQRFAGNGFADISKDANWLFSLACLAEVAAHVGDTTAAAALYELLLPYAGHNVVVGYATACCGSVARQLGVLAATLGRFDEGAGHFEEALAMNARMHARPSLVRTRHGYAQMLMARGDRVDRARDLLEEAHGTAREIGMQGLAAEIGEAVAAKR